MNKKISIAFLFSSTFLFTGCLEDLLSSLCDKLASNNSVIAVFQADPVSYSQQKAKLTYINETTPSTYSVSECDNKFEFPNGERKENPGVSIPNVTFVSVLDEAGDSFFLDANGVAKTDNIRLEITFYPNCADLQADVNGNIFTNPAAALDFVPAVDLPDADIPLLGECKITGQSAVVIVSDR